MKIVTAMVSGFVASVLAVIACFVTMLGIIVIQLGQTVLVSIANTLFGAFSATPPSNIGEVVYVVMFAFLWLVMSHQFYIGNLNWSFLDAASEEPAKKPRRRKTTQPKTE